VAPVKTPKSPRAGDYTDDFIVKKITLRGREFTFRELDVSKYDALVELSTSKNDVGEEMVDNALLRKLMTVASCIDPKLPDGMAGLPMRLANKLSITAQEVNYGIEPEDGEDKEDGPDIQEGEPEAEGEA
jgi:hypothetical protein